MSSSLRRLCLVLSLATLLASGCGLGGAPATPTISSDDVMRTAEAYAQETRQAVTATPSVSPIPPTSTVAPPTATPTPTSTPNYPVVTAKYNVAVRGGPSEEYPVIDLFLQGQTAQVAGRLDDTPIGTWWYIIRIGQGINGWVWGGATDLTGNVAGVPVLEAPPTPED
jgi:hypothetical protein